MSEPGPSEVRILQDSDRIRKFYGQMSDAAIIKHVKSLLEEISKRPDLNIPIPMNYPVVPECVPMIDPKTELEDEDYLEMHHQSTGIEYNYEDDSYTWNRRFGGKQSELIKRVNQLNEYGARRRRQLEADGEEETAESRSPSPPRPAKRGSRGVLPVRRVETPKINGKKEDTLVACKCSICSSDFTTIPSLLDHRRDAHSEKAMLTCGICRKVLSSRTHITFHLTQEYKIHHCSKCETSFASNWHLSKHVCQLSRKRVSEVPLGGEESDEERLQGGEDGLKCAKCGKVYIHIGWLEKHQAQCVKKEEKEIEEEEGNEVTNFKCEICLRVYTSPFWFETHKKKCNASTPTPPVVLPEKPTARCQMCGKMFQNDRSLMFHMRHCRAKQQRLERQRRAELEPQEMDDNDGLVAEPLSQKTGAYATRSTRSQGIRNRVEPSDEEEDCEGEDEEEGEEEDNDEESKKEEGDKESFNPSCSICKTVCSGVINLLSHRRTAHSMSAALTCGICNLKFNCISSITRHMNMEYSLYLCTKCGRNCQDSTVLRQHQCTTGFRPWNYHVGRKSAIVPQNVHIVPIDKPRSAAPMAQQIESPKIVTVTTALQKALLFTTPPPPPPPTTRHQSLKCPNCQESFATSFILYNHRMTCEQPKRRSLEDRQPSTSSAPSTSGRTRTDTIRTQDSSDESQSIKCPECSEEFMYLREIAHHRHTVHQKREFECVYCPATFSLLRTLGDHHNLELKRWKCKDCPKFFTRRYLLAEHQRDGCDQH